MIDPPVSLPTCVTLLCAEKRQAEAKRIRDKYPDRIPVSRERPAFSGGPRLVRVAVMRSCRPFSLFDRSLWRRQRRATSLTSIRKSMPGMGGAERWGFGRGEPCQNSSLSHPGTTLFHSCTCQVPRPRRPDRRSVCVCDPQEDQSQPGKGHFHVCGQGAAPNRLVGRGCGRERVCKLP